MKAHGRLALEDRQRPVDDLDKRKGRLLRELALWGDGEARVASARENSLPDRPAAATGALSRLRLNSVARLLPIPSERVPSLPSLRRHRARRSVPASWPG